MSLYDGILFFRTYIEELGTIICYYENNSTSILTPDIKLIYSHSIVIFRVIIPFMLLLTANIMLFGSLRNSGKQSFDSKGSGRRHGHQPQITPMILFSSCILLLTVSPR